MLDPAITEEDVQRLIADLTLDNTEIGQSATDAWMSLTAGEGPPMLSLAGLQNWLWWLLPKRWHAHDEQHLGYWTESANAAAKLFDLLGDATYADTCRSETTATVLAAWSHSRSKGLAATLKALKESPVSPPDTDNFAWGDVFGSWESNARDAVEVALEEAIDDGVLDPTKARWRKVATQICADTLDEEQHDNLGQSWRSLVLSERAQTWATGPRVPSHHADSRQEIAKQFMSPPPLPSANVTTGPLGLLEWLADACADGVTLTASGYLPRKLVLDAVNTHDWWIWDKPPHSEADVYELAMVHKAARSLGVLRRKGKTLTTTKAGRTIATDPELWWPRLVMHGHGKVAYRDAIFEKLSLALLDGATHEVDDVSNRIGAELAEQGWQSDGQPTTATQHRQSLYMAFNPWRIWGFIDYQPSRGETAPDGTHTVTTSTVSATPAGQAAGSLWMHRQITSPRSDI